MQTIFVQSLRRFIFDYVGEPMAVLNIWSVYPHHKMDDLLGWSDELKASAARVTDLVGGIMPVRTDPITS